jgi:hypothetical protein
MPAYVARNDRHKPKGPVFRGAYRSRAALAFAALAHDAAGELAHMAMSPLSTLANDLTERAAELSRGS